MGSMLDRPGGVSVMGSLMSRSGAGAGNEACKEFDLPECCLHKLEKRIIGHKP